MNFRLSIKIPAIIVGAALFVGCGIGIVSYFTAKTNIETVTKARLAGSADLMTLKVTEYFKSIKNDLELTASNPLTAEAIDAFSTAWNVWEVLGGSPQELLQNAYIFENPHPTGEKHELMTANGGTEYDKQHAKYHPWFKSLQSTRGYYDVFLFDAKGNLVYSVFKELDFATNFKSGGGQWASTDLGEVFRRGFAAPESNPVVFEDFAPYGPSNDAPVSFIAHGVNDENGNRIGVLAYQMPVDKINTLFSSVSALGETGELALVGSDNLLRNDSKFTKADDILTTKLDVTTATQAEGDNATGMFYRDEAMDLRLTSFNFGGVNYKIAAMIGHSEALAPIYDLRNSMLKIGAALLIGMAILGAFVGLSLTRPIGRLVSQMRSLASGDINIELYGLERGDEVGDIAKTAAIFKQNAIERNRLAEEATQSQQVSREREALIETLISNFKDEIAGALQRVEEHTNTMESTANELLYVAEGASEKAVSASSSSEEASVSVSSVATSATQLNDSISAIGKTIVTAKDT